jgi:hypothetical protein
MAALNVGEWGYLEWTAVTIGTVAVLAILMVAVLSRRSEELIPAARPSAPSERDPHVESLTYQLMRTMWVFGKGDDFLRLENPAPLQRETDYFTIRLSERTDQEMKPHVLVVTMKEHHASVESARARVEPYLRAWELHHALTGDLGWFSFRFDEARVTDRLNPSAPAQTVLQLEPGDLRIRGGTITLGKGNVRPTYPEPPLAFEASPDVEALWHRYESYVKGGEPLASVANFLRTFLESGRSRKEAGELYGISGKVLDKLGRLTGEGMGGLMARKYSSALRPYSAQEVQWLEAVVRLLIRRVGEHAAGATTALPVITLAHPDLPTL